MSDDLRVTLQALQYTIECEGKVTIRLPAVPSNMRAVLADEPPSPTGVDQNTATRVTTYTCPTHGTTRTIERLRDGTWHVDLTT